MKCYFYKCDKKYLLLEKGHFKQVHKSHGVTNCNVSVL